jgi:hypothetical protein
MLGGFFNNMQKILLKLLYLLYCAGIAVIVLVPSGYIISLPAEIGLFFSRKTFPPGMWSGVAWFGLNGLVLIIAGAVALLAGVILLVLVMSIEKWIVKQMSPGLKHDLGLDNYVNMLDK